MDFWEIIFLENTLQSWLIALLVFVLTTIGLYIIKRIILRRVAVFAKRTKTDIDNYVTDVLSQTKTLFLLIIALFIATLVLVLPNNARELIRTVVIIVFLIQTAFWGSKAITDTVNRKMKEQMEEDAEDASTVDTLGLVARIILWAVISLLILDNIPGIQVNSLVASLGIGGIAIAIAAQNILGDLFASLSILLDKPFIIGDSIVVDEFSGTIEHIGLKSTHIRSTSGEQLVFSNSDLLNSRIRNYKRMERRRVVSTIGVTYQTPYEKISSIPKMLQEIISAYKNVTFDRAHFKEYGDFSLNFEYVYHMETANYKIFMDTQQSINLDIYKRFEAKGIDFAYPTQTIFVDRNTNQKSREKSKETEET